MAATNFKTENNTFRKLIGNGLTYPFTSVTKSVTEYRDEQKTFRVCRCR